MQNNLTIIIAVSLLSFLIVTLDIHQAFADVTVETITPTGGNLSATSDCTDITRGNGIIWVGCNTLIYAISETTNAVLANVSATTTGSNLMLASVLGTSLYHANNGGTMDKYVLTTSPFNAITKTGEWSDALISIDSDSMIYDELGLIWFTGDTNDRIVRMKPNTMTTSMISQDLTDGVGLECDAPVFVAYATTDNIGVMHCQTNNVYMTFSIASSTSITLLDDIADGTGETGIWIHEKYNRFYVSRSTGIATYSYDGSGVITLVNSGIGIAQDRCHIEPYVSSDVFLVCTNMNTVDFTIQSFFSNSTGLTQITNNLVSYTGGSTLIQIGFDIQDQVWYFQGNLNNHKYVKMSGLREETLEPDPIPSPEEETTANNRNGTNVCGNFDVNGDGKVNVLDCVGGNTAFTGFTSGKNATEITRNITDGLGLTNCGEDGDPETCGSGLFLFIMVLLLVEFLVLAGYLGLTSKLGGTREVIDVLMIMLIAGFAVVALGFYLNWIPDLVFYTIIVLIAGFLTFGIIGKMRGK